MNIVNEPYIHCTLSRPSEISEKKLEHIGKVIFDIPFMIQSYTESMKKILVDPKGLPGFFSYFQHGFPYVLQFFSLISDGLGSVWYVKKEPKRK